MPRLLASGALSEDAINRTVIQYVNAHPYLKGLVLHFPNEGKRTKVYGRSLQEKGMRKGVSDLLIAMPKHGFGGAWIELKSEIGVLKKEQREFLDDMERQNYFTAVTWCLDEALMLINWYCLHQEWKQGHLLALPTRYRTPFQRSQEEPRGKHP